MLGWLCRNGLIWAGNVLRAQCKGPEWIHMVLEGDYPDLRSPRPAFWQRRFTSPQLSLQELAERFNVIGLDSRTKGVVLHLRPLSMPFARLQVLRELIATLQKRGKRVVVWSTGYDTANYYVAAAADEILLQEGGRVAPLGLRYEQLFLANSLAACGLKLDAIQISPYKSAADRLTRTNMSKEAREMQNWLLDAQYQELVKAISDGRGMDEAAAQELVDSTPLTDTKAIELGAVDNIISEEALPEYLGRLNSWRRARKVLRRLPAPRQHAYFAVIRVQGTIVDGKSQRPRFAPPLPLPFMFGPRAGDRTVVTLARRALKDKKVKGVLLYIDSGGGSATASEAMSAALDKLAVEKPVVAMMGSVAASGGYYVATPAHWIIARPGTITGSIGVLTGKLITAGLLEKLLINKETLSRGENSGLEGPDRPFTPDERAKVREFIENTYELFIRRVARARKMDTIAVDLVGGGRVWTGSQALEHGLVDELGGLPEAQAKLRELAGIDHDIALRELEPSAKDLPLLGEPLAALSYARDSLNLLGPGKVLAASALIWQDYIR
ncbi:MAG: signal peptide peptidase SppA [Firmicutes bacterium]|nr:signal peptide peptidase SppA [Bacillota bacterium]